MPDTPQPSEEFQKRLQALQRDTELLETSGVPAHLQTGAPAVDPKPADPPPAEPEPAKAEKPANAVPEGLEDESDENLTDEQRAMRDALLGKPASGGEHTPVPLPAEAMEVFKKVGIEDLNSFLSEELPQMREAAKALEQQSANLDRLPPELSSMVLAALTDEDPNAWRTMAKKYTTVDFSKDPGKMDPKFLISTYGDVQFTEEEWQEYEDKDGDPRIKAQIDRELNAARSRYSEDRENYSGYVENSTKREQERQKAAQESLKPQLDELNKRGLGIFVKQGLANDMMSQAIGPMFRNSDGSFKEDAAFAFVFAKNYNLVLEAVANSNFEKGQESKTLDNIAKAPNRARGARPATKPGVGEALKKKLQQLDFDFSG